jgi:hypothetical protein
VSQTWQAAASASTVLAPHGLPAIKVDKVLNLKPELARVAAHKFAEFCFTPRAQVRNPWAWVERQGPLVLRLPVRCAAVY